MAHGSFLHPHEQVVSPSDARRGASPDESDSHPPSKKSGFSVTEFLSDPYPPAESGKGSSAPQAIQRERGRGVANETEEETRQGPSPWERGKRASELKPEVLLALVFKWFARGRAAILVEENHALDLERDAKSLIDLPECRDSAGRMLERHPGLTKDDVWAAVVSAFLDIAAADFGPLYSAYWRFIAERLQPLLNHPLFGIQLALSEDEKRSAVLEPMSCYFLDSLRTLRSDPNILRTDSDGGKRLRVRPFGWSPGSDPLNGSLSLLILRQTRRTRWPNALMYSPLAYHLRSAGLAEIVVVERTICRRCKKDFSGCCLAGRCPQCHGPLTDRASKYLLSTRHIETRIREGAAGIPARPIAEPAMAKFAKDIAARSREISPSEDAESADELRQDLVIALERARLLWLKVMKRSRRGACGIAVLLSLTGIERVPETSEWMQPKAEWLVRVVRELRRRSIGGDSVVKQAQLLLPWVFQAVGVTSSVRLTVGNIRVILCRLRKGLFSKRWSTCASSRAGTGRFFAPNRGALL